MAPKLRNGLEEAIDRRALLRKKRLAKVLGPHSGWSSATEGGEANATQRPLSKAGGGMGRWRQALLWSWRAPNLHLTTGVGIVVSEIN